MGGGEGGGRMLGGATGCQWPEGIDWNFGCPSHNGQSSFKVKKMLPEKIGEKGW